MRNDPRSAKEFFEKAAQMDPTLAPAHVRLAEAAILLNDFGEARHSLDMAKKLEPDMPALAGLEARLHEAKDAK
jgi:cytochrome c-type biogenesis protein CcmH/NrfG